MEQQQNNYESYYKRSIDENKIEEYWREQLDEIQWQRKPEKIWYREQNSVFNKWFSDGQVNISDNCIDRHEKKNGEQIAIIYDSTMTKQQKKISYKELKEQVEKLSVVYRKQGIKKGDRIIIYMPMIPEAVFSMLASAKVGAIHSVVFGGFSAKELGNRISDAQPTLIMTASCGLEPQKMIDYKEILDEALEMSGYQKKIKVIIVQREQKRSSKIQEGRDFDYFEEMSKVGIEDDDKRYSELINSQDPLYILYTSGTTGQPKGIVRDTGGTCMALNWTMKYIMGINQGDVYFSTSDIGWVVGHSFVVYGPLLRGATSILYEGKPTQTPDPGVYWRIVEQYKVKGMYTAPTAMRAIRKEDNEGQFIKKYDVSSLTQISMAGERCDIPTYQWISHHLPNLLVNDNYWQTESGWIISCNFSNLQTFKSKPGSCTKPVPGFNVKILDEFNQEINAPNVLGRVCIKQPLPPSFMSTLWKNDQAFIEKYMKESPGYYVTGDAGYFDEDCYLNVMSRLDDIINTAGHRLSTAAMEEVLISHQAVVEAAVVPIKDDLRGELPFAFVVLNATIICDFQILKAQLVNLIRKDIGPVACFRHVIVLNKLPKTRSGKILRATLRKILNGEKFNIPPTIEDPDVLHQAKKAIEDSGLLQQTSLKFIGDDKFLQNQELLEDKL